MSFPYINQRLLHSIFLDSTTLDLSFHLPSCPFRSQTRLPQEMTKDCTTWRFTRGRACHPRVCPRCVCVCVCVCVHGRVCVHLIWWQQCRGGNVLVYTHVVCWGVQHLLCISTFDDSCVQARRDTSACFTLWHFLPNCFILPSSPSPSVAFRDEETSRSTIQCLPPPNQHLPPTSPKVVPPFPPTDRSRHIGELLICTVHVTSL